MRSLKHRIARFGLGIGLAATMALGAVVPALADDVVGTASVSGGGLSIASVGTLADFAVTLDGTNQSPTAALAIDVNDDTGTGAGWNLSVKATTFSTGETTPKTLSDSGTLSITGAPAIANRPGGTYTAPINALSGYPLAITTAATPADVKFFSAEAASGLGRFTITPTFQVNVPANTYEGTYTSTLTITLASTP